MADPRLVSLYQEVAVKYPLVRNGGIDNCRKISGSNTWSQHSWGKAVDVMVPSVSYGDQVYRYINGRKRVLGLGTILWKVPNHFDHLHVEVADKGSGVPPCAGGDLTPTRLWGGPTVSEEAQGVQTAGFPRSLDELTAYIDRAFGSAFGGPLSSALLRPMLGVVGLVMVAGGVYGILSVYNVAPSMSDIKDTAAKVVEVVA